MHTKITVFTPSLCGPSPYCQVSFGMPTGILQPINKWKSVLFLHVLSRTDPATGYTQQFLIAHSPVYPKNLECCVQFSLNNFHVLSCEHVSELI